LGSGFNPHDYFKYFAIFLVLEPALSALFVSTQNEQPSRMRFTCWKQLFGRQNRDKTKKRLAFRTGNGDLDEGKPEQSFFGREYIETDH
jgi:hypothetical protein